MDEIDEYPTQNLTLYPCDICQRKFQQATLVKHRNICKKSSQKGRKIFDSGKQRSEGSDVIYQKTKDTKKVQILGQKPEIAPPNSNWREKHDQFIKNVRNARVVTEAIKTGAPVPKFEASAVPSDYVNCGFCGRNFSSAAAERHIPFCEQQKKRQKINNSANQKPKINYPKKYSSDANSANDNASNNIPRGYNPNRQGYTSGNDRKPIKYDSNLYYDSDVPDNGSGYGSRYGSGYGGNYGIKNNSAKQQYSAKTKQEQILRTGRNQSNNDLNTLARNRGQKDSPLQSRDPSKSRYGNQPSPSGPNKNATYGRQVSQQNNVHNEGLGATSKFCHECGSEFPVKWARFCSFCGDRRL